MARGALPVRTWQACSAKVVLRRWCSASMPPVTPDPVGQAGGVGLGGGQVGDRVHRHGAPAPAGKGPDPAGEAQRLGGVGKFRPATVATCKRRSSAATITCSRVVTA
jgi:hypothetical protein